VIRREKLFKADKERLNKLIIMKKSDVEKPQASEDDEILSNWGGSRQVPHKNEIQVNRLLRGRNPFCREVTK